MKKEGTEFANYVSIHLNLQHLIYRDLKFNFTN
jgi:hypothetical protein